MPFTGQTAVVTGAGQGIGRALCIALAAAGARVMVSDIDADRAKDVADKICGAHCPCDVRDPDQIADLVATTQRDFGPIDIWISNAGFAQGEPFGAISASDDHWQDSWDIHVMAHLRAARLVVPAMVARGSGAVVNISSAAGLLCQIGDAAYSATKHAAVSLAQSLAIDYGDKGVQVSVVCPLYVATPLLGYAEDAGDALSNDRVLTPDAVAKATLDGLQNQQFLILPHAEAATFFLRRAQDTNRWIAAMRNLRADLDGVIATGGLGELHKHLSARR